MHGAEAALPATGSRVVPRGTVGAVAVGAVILDGLPRAMALLTVLHRAAHRSTGWRDAGLKGGGSFRADLREEHGDEGGGEGGGGAVEEQVVRGQRARRSRRP